MLLPRATPTTCNITIVFLLSRSIDEMKRLEEMSAVFQSPGVERHPPEPKSQTEGNEDSGGRKAPWEMVMDKKHFKLWRRPITGSHHYQYRGESSVAALWVPWLPQVLRTSVPQTKLSVLVISQEILHGLLFVVFPLLNDKSLPMSSLLYCAVGCLCHPMTSSF